MNLLGLLIKIQGLIEQAFPNITIGFVLVLLTISISATIGILLASTLFLKNRNISESFYLFIYSFLGCLSGGVFGSVAGAFIGIIVAAFTPAGDGLFVGLAGIGIATILADTIAICWFIGILIGGVITAKPLIEFFDGE